MTEHTKGPWARNANGEIEGERKELARQPNAASAPDVVAADRRMDAAILRTNPAYKLREDWPMPKAYNPAAPPAVAFPTPWAPNGTRLVDARGVQLVFEAQGLGHSGPKVLVRIAACVNALAGIPTNALIEADQFVDVWDRLGCLRDIIEGVRTELARRPGSLRGEG